MSVVPVFAADERVARACRAGGARACPVWPGDRRATSRRPAASSGCSRSGRGASSSSRAVTRSSRESPEPSTMRTPATGMPAAARSRLVDRGAGRGRARAERLVADRLQHHLGREVVAPVIHELEDLARAAPSRSSRAGPRRAGRGRVDRAAGDDPARVEQAVEVAPRRRGPGRRRGGCCARRGRRRAPRAAATRCRRTTAASRARSRFESNAESSPTMPPVTRRMPSRQRIPTSRLRSAEVSVGSPKPLRTSRPCHVLPDPPALAEHLGREAVARAELDERRVRDAELLVRRGLERDVGVAREDDLARSAARRPSPSTSAGTTPSIRSVPARRLCRLPASGARDCTADAADSARMPAATSERTHHQIGFCRTRRSPARREPRD